MADFSDGIKRLALAAVEAAKPVDILTGTVVSADPLRIKVEQKFTLEADQLILARGVTDHQIDMSVDHFTEDETQHTHRVSDTYTGGGSSFPGVHRHGYAGRKRFTVHNRLAEGENVLLLRMCGGQKFIIWDKIV